MSQTLLEAAWRVETMVGRRQDLERIKEAIYGRPENKDCRVVLVTGPGGIGKSRLLEEVQWRAGNPGVRQEAQARQAIVLEEREDWTPLGEVTVSDTVDLMDIRLTARLQILQTLRDALALEGGVDFVRFEAAQRAYQERLRTSASFDQLKKYAAAAEEAFWQDFEAHTQQRRIVLVLDTAERLALHSSQWALDRGLLKEEELVLSSQQWLLSQLSQERFANTTLVIAGRAEEGAPFFQRLRTTLQRMGIEPIEIEPRPLTRDETTQYFQFLAREWQERAKTINGLLVNGDYGRICDTMDALAQDQEQLDVLHLVTGGRPVLLSLYGDLIHESEEIPELLRLSRTEIEEKLNHGGRAAIQGEIERAFIDTLFRAPGLRSDIMQALARCPAGLDAEQLHFLLDGNGKQAVEWQPFWPRVEQIASHLMRIRYLSLGHPRPRGRLGLQDEIYRIYAQRTGELDNLREYEMRMRQDQYGKLNDWAEEELREARAKLRAFLEDDERRIGAAIHLPTQALRPYIPPPTDTEQDERAEAQEQLWDWELERLHYRLLSDPAAGLNDDYVDLAERIWHDNNEERDFIAQQDMWRVLYDEHALQFTGYADEQIIRFRDGAREEDVARWIKRFIMRRQYPRAIEFYDAAEQAIAAEPEEQRRSWQRPINDTERRIWRDYAQIMVGQDASKAVQDIEKSVAQLDKDTSPGEHAPIRQQRVVGTGYNFAGYGYAAPLGQFNKAVEAYGKALWYIRQTRSTAQQAGIRNNQGHALASLGREERGYRVCVDALEARREQGAAIPVAISLNTLALINNAMQRLPSAWRQAAQAAAISRRAGDNRALGLALIQLAIALRHLANSREPAVALEATPVQLYETARLALGEAIDIFRNSPEVLRWVEATLEIGCVLRDQLKLIDRAQATPRELRLLDRLYSDAKIEFNRAIDQADERGFRYLALQAQVDLAWAHFFVDRFAEAERTAEQAKARINLAYILNPGEPPTDEAGETHYFYQLAKLHGLHGSIAMKRFVARREEWRRQIGVSDRHQFYKKLEGDAAAQEFMDAAAENYVLALYYGQLFSPRSRSLVITFDQIYDFVKAFNPVEYGMFYRAQQKASATYRPKEEGATPAGPGRPPFDFSDLEKWLDDCFGPLSPIEGEG